MCTSSTCDSFAVTTNKFSKVFFTLMQVWIQISNFIVSKTYKHQGRNNLVKSRLMHINGGACKTPEIVLEVKIHEKLIGAFKVQL